MMTQKRRRDLQDLPCRGVWTPILTFLHTDLTALRLLGSTCRSLRLDNDLHEWLWQVAAQKGHGPVPSKVPRPRLWQMTKDVAKFLPLVWATQRLFYHFQQEPQSWLEFALLVQKTHLNKPRERPRGTALTQWITHIVGEAPMTQKTRRHPRAIFGCILRAASVSSLTATQLSQTFTLRLATSALQHSELRELLVRSQESFVLHIAAIHGHFGADNDFVLALKMFGAVYGMIAVAVVAIVLVLDFDVDVLTPAPHLYYEGLNIMLEDLNVLTNLCQRKSYWCGCAAFR
jgi:hypothetical protein